MHGTSKRTPLLTAAAVISTTALILLMLATVALTPEFDDRCDGLASLPQNAPCD